MFMILPKVLKGGHTCIFFSKFRFENKYAYGIGNLHLIVIFRIEIVSVITESYLGIVFAI